MPALGSGGAARGGSSAESVASKGGNDADVGFVIGSGMDVKLAERISFGMEGLYYAFYADRIDVIDNSGDRIARIDSANDFYLGQGAPHLSSTVNQVLDRPRRARYRVDARGDAIAQPAPLGPPCEISLKVLHIKVLHNSRMTLRVFVEVAICVC